VSWHYLQGQEAASWEGSSLDGAPSALLSLLPTREQSCSHDSETECSHDSPSGMTSAHLTANHGADTLTSSRAASPARTSQAQVKAPESQESDPGSGRRWLGSLARYDRDTSSWKTPQCSLFGDSELFSAAWPRWGLMRDGVCWGLSTPERPTRGTASGSLLATPTATANQLAPSMMKHPGCRAWLPTPVTQGLRGGSDSEHASFHLFSPGHPGHGALNPTWIEWLMGWPVGWTDLEPQATDRYQQWQRSHGER
jgi:hypothetical protein